MLFCICSSCVSQSYLFVLLVELVDEFLVLFAELVLIDVDCFVAFERFFSLEFWVLVIFVFYLNSDVLVV